MPRSSWIFNDLLTFLEKLESKHISYRLEHNRHDAVMVSVVLPGERWEVEFLSDGTVEVEKFRSEGKIEGEESLGELKP